MESIDNGSFDVSDAELQNMVANATLSGVGEDEGEKVAAEEEQQMDEEVEESEIDEEMLS